MTEQQQALRAALDHLRAARTAAKTAGAPKTLQRIGRAIDSCEGAIRHADNMADREAVQVALNAKGDV